VYFITDHSLFIGTSTSPLKVMAYKWVTQPKLSPSS